MAEKTDRSHITPISKVSTRIPGLDEVLYGGLPKGRTTLIKGASGSGKTVLGLEILCRSAQNGKPAIFVCFEETAGVLRENAAAMGLDLAALERENKFFIWEARVDQQAVVSGEFSIDSLLAVIRGKAAQMGAQLIMIDAIDVLMRIFRDPVRQCSELMRLHDWLIDQELTTLVTAKELSESDDRRYYEFLAYMADCVLMLDLRVVRQVTTRRLRVVKYRGSGFYGNEYPYIITDAGSVIMPITAMQLRYQFSETLVVTGSADLDTILGGGVRKGTAVLIAGPTGSGKTTLAATFSQSACGRGERVLYISFEESMEAIVQTMRSPGIDLRPAMDSGRLQFHSVMPEALVAEEHLYLLLREIERFQPNHLIVDAISACKRLASEQMAFDFLVRLIDICKQRAVTCLMTNQVASTQQRDMISGIGISSILDTLVVIRFVEDDGSFERELTVIKSRGLHHSNRHHRFRITDEGIQFKAGEPERS